MYVEYVEHLCLVLPCSLVEFDLVHRRLRLQVKAVMFYESFEYECNQLVGP